MFKNRFKIFIELNSKSEQVRMAYLEVGVEDDEVYFILPAWWSCELLSY
jgi:hypothetical protein